MNQGFIRSLLLFLPFFMVLSGYLYVLYDLTSVQAIGLIVFLALVMYLNYLLVKWSNHREYKKVARFRTNHEGENRTIWVHKNCIHTASYKKSIYGNYVSRVKRIPMESIVYIKKEEVTEDTCLFLNCVYKTKGKTERKETCRIPKQEVKQFLEELYDTKEKTYST